MLVGIMGSILHAETRPVCRVGVLDHGRKSLLRHAARFQEAREIAAGAKLRDTQLDGPGTRLPVSLAVAITLRKPERAFFSP